MKKNLPEHSGRGYIYEKENGIYREHTYGEFCEDVHRFADHIIRNRLGSRIALYAANSYRYMVIDAAVMAFVGLCVTMSKEWTLDDVDSMLSVKDIDTLIYDREREATALRLQSLHPDIRFISLEQMEPDKSYRVYPEQPLEASCKVIFSSGTTGTPKGVMLSQKSMFASWDNLRRRAPLTCDDIDYLFLPLHHTYAGICNFLYSIDSVMKIYLCSDTKMILEELSQVRPTAFCAVPLICERIYKLCKEKNLDPRAVFGGRLKYLFCGGAYMSPEIRRFFRESGLNLMGAYGMSETSSLISTEYSNAPTDNESCGRIYEHLDVKAALDGEILVKGDNLFNGYYQAEELTRQSFTEDGYFKTGDLGEVRDGNVYLYGRKKRVILFSNGENVYPDDIEKRLEKNDIINKATVFERDKQIVALLYVGKPGNCDEVVEAVNRSLPKYSRIRSYRIVQDSIVKRIK